MKLTFLGLGSAFNPAMNNTAAYFVLGDELYLLDCGETVFSSIWNSKALEDCSRVTVVISHLHCDHVGSLGSLISYCATFLKKPIRIIHPLGTVTSLLDLLGIKRSKYTWLPDLKAANSEGVSFKPIEIEHVDTMQSYGYLISDSEKTIYYSGDSKFVPLEVINAFLKGEVDEIYQDTSFNGNDKANHCSFEWLEKTFAREFRSRIYCIHLDSDYREVIKAAGFNVPVDSCP